MAFPDEGLLALVREGDVAAVRAHLDEGGDPNERGVHGQTALHRCVSDYQTDTGVWFTPQREEVMRLLLAGGADPSLASNDGWRPLTAAAVLGNEGALRLLLDHGVALEPDDWKALVFAVEWRNLHTAAILLQRGADPDTADPDGRTPLMRAARKSFVPGVEFMLSHGADPNARDAEGWTALMFAATKARVESVHALLAAGADRAARNAAGETALDIAREKRKAKIVAVLG